MLIIVLVKETTIVLCLLLVPKQYRHDPSWFQASFVRDLKPVVLRSLRAYRAPV